MMGVEIQATTIQQEDVVIDVENSISNKFKGWTTGQSPNGKYQMVTIPKVPERLRKLDEINDSYEPRIISIGPYHRGNKRFEAMEKHKWRYLKAILSRNQNRCLKDYIEKIKASEMRARGCYSEMIDNKDFVEMMLLDGCFIVEFLLRDKKNEEKKLHKTNKVEQENEADELFSMIWMVPQIRYDILLLENQLPFFILQHIFDLATENQRNPSLVQLATNVCTVNVCKIYDIEKTTMPLPESVYHLLHLSYLFILPSSHPDSIYSHNPSRQSNKSKFMQLLNSIGFNVLGSSTDDYEESVAAKTDAEAELVAMIPSATLLGEAGIVCKKKENGGSILDVEFRGGIMTIPHLLIDSFTMYRFRNLITFEQLCSNMEARFSAYVLFMDYLVNKSNDVALLHEEGIIDHLLGSDGDVAGFFNSLTRATFRPQRHYLNGMYRQVNKYVKTKRHRWRAALVHNYFNGPWAALSVLAAIILLGLTSVQTFFSVYAYARPP